MSHRRSVVFRTLLSALLLLFHVSTASAQVGWTPPVTIAGISQTGGTILAPKVAVDPAGNAVAVFLDAAGGALALHASSFAAATGNWSPPVRISQPVGLGRPPLIGAFAVGVDADGNALVAFEENVLSTPYSLRIAKYTRATNSWVAAPFSASFVSSSRLAVNAAGDAIVTWLQSDLPNAPLLASRYAVGSGTWSAPQTIRAANVSAPALAIDAGGNAQSVWLEGDAIKSSRFDAAVNTWSAVATLATSLPQPSLPAPYVTMNARGDAVATWVRGTAVEAARYSYDATGWTAEATLSTGGQNNDFPRAVVDPNGFATVAWVNTTTPDRIIQASRSSPANGVWGAPLVVSGSFAYGPPAMAVDANGEVFIVWSQSLASPGIRLAASRGFNPSTVGSFTTNISALGQNAYNPSVGVDARGNAIAVWFQTASGFGTTQASRFVATPGAVRITGVTPSNGAIVVAVDPDTSGATSFEYSFDGTTWTPLSGPIAGLTNGVAYPLRVRGVNAAGAGIATPVMRVRSGIDTNPTNFRVVGASGNQLTFAWTAPAAGIAPTGYLLEGGIVPLSTLASVPTGGSATTATFTLPVGSFSARIVALYGTQRLGTSNELAFSVGGPQLPAAPTGLVGSAVGAALTLSWTNRFELGTPTGVRLDVSGALSTSLPLALGESFSFSNVPAGTYTFTVSATNAAGASAPSSPVTLTFPGAGTCATPQAPTAYSAGVTGSLVALAWEPPAAGPPVTGYVLQVTGAFTGTLPVAARTLSIPAPAGSYSIAVAATNACGTGAFTAAQAVVVP